MSERDCDSSGVLLTPVASSWLPMLVVLPLTEAVSELKMGEPDACVDCAHACGFCVNCSCAVWTGFEAVPPPGNSQRPERVPQTYPLVEYHESFGSLAFAPAGGVGMASSYYN